MSVLSYNGVTLPYCDHNAFRMEAVYDDRGQVDRMLTRFDIQVNCLITADCLDLLAPELIGVTTSPAIIMQWVQERLLTPRRVLSFQFNGVEFVPQPAGVRGYIDAANGPKPQSCVFTDMGNMTWWLTYHVTATYRVHYTILPLSARITNLPGNVALSCRWRETVQIDNCDYSTRTRSGKIIIRSDNLAGAAADEVRSQLAVVGVPPGFLRERHQYTVSEDGLGLEFEVVDREVWASPPQGAFEADGYYEEEGTRGDGKRVGQCMVRLRGGALGNKFQLARTAAAVCAGQLDVSGAQFLNPDPGRRGIIEQSRMKVWLYDNQVECFMRALYAAQTGRIQGVAFMKPGAFDTAGSAQFVQPPYRDRGSAGLLLSAAAYYNPDLAAQLGDGDLFYQDNPLTPPNRIQLVGPGAGGDIGAAGKTPPAGGA